MARDFNGSSDFLYRTSLFSTVIQNITFCFWANINKVDGTEQVLFSNGVDTGGGGSNGYSLEIYTDNAFKYLMNGVSRNDTGTTATTGLQHLLVERRVNTWQLYVNGTAAASSTSAGPNSPTTAVSLGAQAQSGTPTAFRFFDGQISEFGFWEVGNLDAGERAALAKGVAPDRVRPAALILYSPLFGQQSPEPSRHSLYDWTLSGTSAAEHSKVFRGRKRMNSNVRITPSLGGDGTDMPWPLQQRLHTRRSSVLSM